MKNIENRVAKLELQIPKNDFLIVTAAKGEHRDAAIKRVMVEQEIKQPVSDFFIIYLNLSGNR